MTMNSQIGEYDVYSIILDLGSDVNTPTKHTWEMMGNPQLVWSCVQLCLANQAEVSLIGRVPHLPVEVEGLKTYEYFDVIEIIDNTRPYLTLLGIGWAMKNMEVINFKKRTTKFEPCDMRVISPLDPLEGQ